MDGVEKAVTAILAALLLGVLGVVIWAAVSGQSACPPGQHQVQTGVIVTIVGKVPVTVPIFGCQS